MKLFELFATLGLDSSGFESGIKDAGALMSNLKGDITSAFKTIGNVSGKIISTTSKAVTVAGGAIAAAVTAASKAGIEYNAEMEKYKTAFTSILGSEKEAEKVMSQIRQDAATTPFDVKGLTQGIQMLTSTGLSADSARKTVLALGDALAATGGGADEMSRMIQNLQQIKNAGEASGADIKQFAYAGVDIYGIMADYYGKTTEEVKKMKIGYDDLSNALIKAASKGGRFYNAMYNQSKTFNGQLSNLQDNFEMFRGTMTEGIFETFRDKLLPVTASWIDRLQAAADSAEDGMGRYVAVIKEASKISQEFSKTVSAGVPKALDAFKDFTAQVGPAITAAIPSAVQAGKDVFEGVRDGFRAMLPYIVDAAKEIGPEVFRSVIAFKGDMLTAGIEIIGGIAEGIVENKENIGDSISQLIGSIVKALSDNSGSIIEGAGELVLAIGDGIIENQNEIESTVTQIVEQISDWLIENAGQVIEAGVILGKALISGVAKGVSLLPAKLLDSIFGTDAAEQMRNATWFDYNNVLKQREAEKEERKQYAQGVSGDSGYNAMALASGDMTLSEAQSLVAKTAAKASAATAETGIVAQTAAFQVSKAAQEIRNYGQLAALKEKADWEAAQASEKNADATTGAGTAAAKTESALKGAAEAASELQTASEGAAEAKDKALAGGENGVVGECAAVVAAMNEVTSAANEAASAIQQALALQSQLQVDDSGQFYRSTGGGGSRENYSLLDTAYGASNTFGKRHAVGLSSVPFDGYLAKLHRGEAVLTRQEADAYRGQQRGQRQEGVTIVQNIQAVAMRPSEVAAQTRHAFDRMRFAI